MLSIATEKLKPWGPSVIRLALGIIFIAHGGQKLFGLWGGAGLSATMEDFEQHMGIPPFLTAIAALTEFFGGGAVLIGLLTRLASVGLAVVMVVAMFEAHLAHGFFINWEMTPGKGHGVEFNIALLAMSLALLVSGPGKWSVDRLLNVEKG